MMHWRRCCSKPNSSAARAPSVARPRPHHALCSSNPTSILSTPGQSSSSSRPTLPIRSEEHTSELQSRLHLVCRLLLEKKKTRHYSGIHSAKPQTGSTLPRRLRSQYDSSAHSLLCYTSCPRSAHAYACRQAAVSPDGVC